MPAGGGTLGSPVYPQRPRPPSSLQEHTLSFIIGYDPITLREKVDLLAAGARLAELGNLRSLAALNEKVALLRLVGRLDEAWEIANEALRQSRFTGNREQAVASRIRRAQVLQFQGKLEEAVSELTTAFSIPRCTNGLASPPTPGSTAARCTSTRATSKARSRTSPRPCFCARKTAPMPTNSTAHCSPSR